MTAKRIIKEKNLPAIVETLLFAYGEPMALAHMAKLLEEEETEIKAALRELEEAYGTDRFVILEKDGMYQLGTNPAYAEYVAELIKRDMREELSRAAAETLAIVAYKGPLTRAEVEYIRGVNSSFSMRNLLLRGLVERTENPKDARSPLYRVSFDLLKYLGIKKGEELPSYAEFRAELASVVKEAATNAAS
ncbi:MAG: SMC-Scp complex subunit ScpB [Candidatus Sungbacteria bacterium]|nr:SMC-Scp complex subunit ScpB [Candidatus Sungbacteria bacterium]